MEVSAAKCKALSWTRELELINDKIQWGCLWEEAAPLIGEIMGIIADKSRWINWELVPNGEDFWDMMEEIEKKKQIDLKAEQQDKEIKRKFSKRLDHKITDKYIADGVATEEYGFMMKDPLTNNPNKTKVKTPNHSPRKREKRNGSNHICKQQRESVY